MYNKKSGELLWPLWGRLFEANQLPCLSRSLPHHDRHHNHPQVAFHFHVHTVTEDLHLKYAGDCEALLCSYWSGGLAFIYILMDENTEEEPFKEMMDWYRLGNHVLMYLI